MTDDTNDESDLVRELDEQIDQALRRVVELLHQDRSTITAAIEAGDVAAVERSFAQLQAARPDDDDVEAAVDEVVRLRKPRALAGAAVILVQGSADE